MLAKRRFKARKKKKSKFEMITPYEFEQIKKNITTTFEKFKKLLESEIHQGIDVPPNLMR
jgi:hypothetical protein